MTLISHTITLPSPLPHPGRRNEAGLAERGVKEQIRLSPPFPLQNPVLQTPQTELGFSTLNPIKPLIPPAGSRDDTVSQGSGAEAGSFRPEVLNQSFLAGFR